MIDPVSRACNFQHRCQLAGTDDQWLSVGAMTEEAAHNLGSAGDVYPGKANKPLYVYMYIDA